MSKKFDKNILIHMMDEVMGSGEAKKISVTNDAEKEYWVDIDPTFRDGEESPSGVEISIIAEGGVCTVGGNGALEWVADAAIAAINY